MLLQPSYSVGFSLTDHPGGLSLSLEGICWLSVMWADKLQGSPQGLPRTFSLLASGSSSQRTVGSECLPVFVYEGFPEDFGCLEASASSLHNSVDLLLDDSKYASAKPASLLPYLETSC